MSLVIRPLEKADEARWRIYWALYNDFYKRTISEEVTASTFSRFIDPSVELYCAVAQQTILDPQLAEPDVPDAPAPELNRIVGFVTWLSHMSTSNIKPVVYLNDLFVDPAVRKGGTGGKLIDHVYDWCRSNDAASCYWTTQHFNHAAQLLYVKKATKTDFVKYQKIFL